MKSFVVLFAPNVNGGCSGTGLTVDRIDARSRIGRGHAGVVGSLTPLQLDVLSTGPRGQVDDRGDVSRCRRRAAGKAAPRHAPRQRIPQTGTECRVVSAGNETSPGDKNVLKRSTINADLQDHPVVACLSIKKIPED